MLFSSRIPVVNKLLLIVLVSDYFWSHSENLTVEFTLFFNLLKLRFRAIPNDLEVVLLKYNIK